MRTLPLVRLRPFALSAEGRRGTNARITAATSKRSAIQCELAKKLGHAVDATRDHGRGEVMGASDDVSDDLRFCRIRNRRLEDADDGGVAVADAAEANSFAEYVRISSEDARPESIRQDDDTATRRPFLFDVEQACCLLAVASQLPSTPRVQYRGETYKMIFALLYGLGLRVGEVSRLCCKDINLDHQVLTIRQTKFGKERLVPFGPKMAREITSFLQREESRFGQISPDSPVFSFNKRKRKPIGPNTISYTFHKLLPKLRLLVPSGVAPPHLHCLRHSFAVGTLLRWYRQGVDPKSRLYDLSTFPGHVSPSSTAVYLTITTELLECAGARFALYAEKIRKESVL
jgi:integrase